ncbi:MAG: xanthine/uracil/vitamin C permease, partial [Gammaproteobacteria bacterium HGW-Gammaproteobacteria-9]
MQIFKRRDGDEQPYWPLGPFKLRLPFVHYRWETAEMLQALIMFVVSLAMIPLLEKYLGLPYDVALAYVVVCGLGLPYDVALAYVVVCGIGFMLPALLGVPLVPGWITPGIPVVLLFLGDFEPGPQAIQALFALQFLVFVIFLFLGVTRLGSALVRLIPNSMKGGIIIGAGIAALMGEISAGGRLANTPISLVLGSLICLYLMFSVSFKGLTERVPLARKIVNYGMVPGMLIAIFIGIAVGEYKMPDVKWGITAPAFGEMWNYLPFNVGFPSLDVFMLAVPTAVIAYVIAFGDIIVGQSLMQRADELRTDEVI